MRVVDTPGALQEQLTNWIEEADFIIVPTLMSNRDTAPLERMIKIMEPYEKKKPILYVLNKWNRYNITKDFIKWFQAKYPDLHTAILCDTTAFGQAGAYGVSIVEYQAKSLGAKQIGEIYGIVKYHLNLRERWRA